MEPVERHRLLAALMESAPADLPARYLERPGWYDAAACRGMDVAVFFPGRGDLAAVDAARAVCDGCPVVFECRRQALDDSEHLAGIWAGTSQRQRSQMRRAAVSA